MQGCDESDWFINPISTQVVWFRFKASYEFETQQCWTLKSETPGKKDSISIG